MVKRIVVLASVVVGMALGSAKVHADAVTVDAYRDPGKSPLALHYTLGGEQGASFAQMFRWHRTDGTASRPWPEFVSFCIEITQVIYPSTVYEFELVNLADAPRPELPGMTDGMREQKADLIRELWGRHFDEIADRDPAKEKQNEAAFQTAVWEIVNDTGLSLSDGYFKADYAAGQTPAFVSLAQDWLNTLDGTGPFWRVAAISNLSVQDQVVSVAPIPSAAWGGAVLLLAAGLRRIFRPRNTI